MCPPEAGTFDCHFLFQEAAGTVAGSRVPAVSSYFFFLAFFLAFFFVAFFFEAVFLAMMVSMSGLTAVEYIQPKSKFQ
ncbi:MAG: hypothetical protein IT486_03980 [Gammaproteobacteria bacterium]|nr:hypothetical protein [Gammaproteobacteria bacterium]